MGKRSTKFYRKNEAEVMKSLGMKPTKNSGAGWIEKEDGDNDYVICQLKSTDAQSIRVQQKDIRILEKNARVSHKIPLFAIQFLNTGEVWLMVKPENISDIVEYINTGICEKPETMELEDLKPKITKTISGSKSGREKFYEEKEKQYDKTKWANRR